ncbi:hypothetical protein GUJ93_ZPchr0005g16112 [Zizania palustris]|uniref:Uncharacterized protein n=1 Tax=Zizania palustris TaxID=103762 RepID=A0A8J5S328_ZIZPA|nr:hypothetical protein GUJ93_ZPchr0005g16112 [Zizania palustris]
MSPLPKPLSPKLLPPMPLSPEAPPLAPKSPQPRHQQPVVVDPKASATPQPHRPLTYSWILSSPRLLTDPTQAIATRASAASAIVACACSTYVGCATLPMACRRPSVTHQPCGLTTLVQNRV